MDGSEERAIRIPGAGKGLSTALGNGVLVRRPLVRCSSCTVLLRLSPVGELCGTAQTAPHGRTWVGVGVAKVGRGCQKLIFRGFHVV